MTAGCHSKGEAGGNLRTPDLPVNCRTKAWSKSALVCGIQKLEGEAADPGPPFSLVQIARFP